MKKKIVPLSEQTKEIILGSLLGDGSLRIHEPYRNARFSFRHSVGQRLYFDWKKNQLNEISSQNCVWLQKADEKSYSSRPKIRYQSLATESLTELFVLTHKRGKLEIRRKWLNMLTPLSLAVWWMDDGSIISNGRKGVICTDGFSDESVKILAKYLQKVWDIKVNIASVKKPRDGKKEKYFRLWLRSTEELKKFLRIILPHIQVEEMLSKAILLYKDNQLLERWISEIEENSKFSRETVEKYVSIKKSKWKNFQKMI
jgi:hypothetical protein